MSIVCIGDSLTFGYGVNESESWVSIVSARIEEKITNKGVPGNTTFEMKERFIKDVVNLKPSKVLIMGGTNDIFLGTHIDCVLNNINSMVEMCEVNNIIPIILAPLPVKENIVRKLWFEDMDYKIVNESLAELGDLLVRYAKGKNIISVDLGNILLKKGNGNIEEYYLEDGIHVSKEIHKEMAEIIYKGLF